MEVGVERQFRLPRFVVLPEFRANLLENVEFHQRQRKDVPVVLPIAKELSVLGNTEPVTLVLDEVRLHATVVG